MSPAIEFCSKEESLESCYGSQNSPQSSEDNLNLTKLNNRDGERTLLEDAPKNDNNETSNRIFTYSVNSVDSSLGSNDGTETSWIPVLKENELQDHRVWYDRLIGFREQVMKGERGPFPPFPPPPPPSSFLSASLATVVNPFDEIKHSNVKDFDHYLKQRNHKQYSYRFQPSDFPVIPPPHIFLSMVKTLSPHQYIDLTYAIAGSILLDLRVRIPENFPPLPPKVEPMSKWMEEHSDHSDVSSQSSSDGEYSDDSIFTKAVQKKAKAENIKRRSARRVKILSRMDLDDEEIEKQLSQVEKRKNALEHENNYKMRTLSRFIPNFSNPSMKRPYFNSPFPPLSPAPFNFPMVWNPIFPYVFAAMPYRFAYNSLKPPNFSFSPSATAPFRQTFFQNENKLKRSARNEEPEKIMLDSKHCSPARDSEAQPEPKMRDELPEEITVKD